MKSNALAEKLSVFDPLSLTDLGLVEELTARRLHVPAGRDIILEGDNPRDVHVVLDGTACRYKNLDKGRRQIVGFVLPGDFCDLHVFILKAIDHSIAATTDVTLAKLKPDAIQRMLSRPALTHALFMSTLIEESVLREWIANIGQRSAHDRIAHLFCEIYLRLKVVGRARGGVFRLGISQADLGDTVGLSTVHVNRSLTMLRREGAIDYDRDSISITDFAKLKAIGDFRSNYLHFSDDDEPGQSMQARPRA